MTKKLDTELAEAAGLLDEPSELQVQHATAAATAVAQGESAAVGGPRVRHLGLLVLLLVVVSATVTLFLFGFKDAAVYAMGVDELVERRDELLGRQVRIDGELVPKTLVKRDRPCEYRFRVRKGGQELAVRYPQCVIPDNLRDRPGGVELTIEGSYSSDGSYFRATEILAQCSSRYDPSTHTMKPAAGVEP